MKTPDLLSDKSAYVLGLIATGYSYAQILATDSGLTYQDIFAAAQEAVQLDESEGPTTSNGTSTPGSSETTTIRRSRRRHARKYQPWLASEDGQLAALHAAGKNKHEIAEELERQTSAITYRLRMLGLVP